MRINLKRLLNITLLALTATLGLSSCTKEIDIDLDNAENKLVVDANITDEPGPYLVRLTNLQPYLSRTPAEGVKGAFVTVKDDQGYIDTLKDMGNGNYLTTGIQGRTGHTYYLTILLDGKTYTAQSFLPYSSDIDSISSVYRNRPPVYEPGYYVTVHAAEPKGVGQNYRFRAYRNDTLFNTPQDIAVATDEWVDGNYISVPVQYRFLPGDTMTGELWGITREEYEYWNNMLILTNSTGLFDPPMANPKTNLTGGAVGFFSAHSVRKKTIVIK